MSRWTTRFACAWETAAATSRSRRRRASTLEPPRVAVAVDALAVDVLEDEIGLPPGGDARRRAGARRAGCTSRARIEPSRRNRSSPLRPTRLAFRSLTATRPSKRPSLRRASQTLPMPPWPIGSTRVYAPTAWPAREAGGRRDSGSSRNSAAHVFVVEREERLDLGGEARVADRELVERGAAVRSPAARAFARGGARAPASGRLSRRDPADRALASTLRR